MNKDQRMLEEALGKVIKGTSNPYRDAAKKSSFNQPQHQYKQQVLQKEKEEEVNDEETTPEEQKVASELKKNPDQGLSDQEFDDVLELLKKAN
jgi:formate-dependent nitrite reductase cytochrome c552 subunit